MAATLVTNFGSEFATSLQKFSQQRNKNQLLLVVADLNWFPSRYNSKSFITLSHKFHQVFLLTGWNQKLGRRNCSEKIYFHVKQISHVPVSQIATWSFDFHHLGWMLRRYRINLDTNQGSYPSRWAFRTFEFRNMQYLCGYFIHCAGAIMTIAIGTEFSGLVRSPRPTTLGKVFCAMNVSSKKKLLHSEFSGGHFQPHCLGEGSLCVSSTSGPGNTRK